MSLIIIELTHPQAIYHQPSLSDKVHFSLDQQVCELVKLARAWPHAADADGRPAVRADPPTGRRGSCGAGRRQRQQGMADGISPAFPGYERTVSGALAEDRHAVNTIAEAPANPERGSCPSFSHPLSYPGWH
jgi:hypothetical protein